MCPPQTVGDIEADGRRETRCLCVLVPLAEVMGEDLKSEAVAYEKESQFQGLINCRLGFPRLVPMFQLLKAKKVHGFRGSVATRECLTESLLCREANPH